MPIFSYHRTVSFEFVLSPQNYTAEDLACGKHSTYEIAIEIC